MARYVNSDSLERCDGLTFNAQSVTVTIADVCPTCDNGNSIDLSVGAFKAIAELGDGHVPSESILPNLVVSGSNRICFAVSWKFV